MRSRHAEGAARAVRAADGAVAGARGAGGGRGQGGGRRLARRGRSSRCCRRASSWRCRSSRTARAARCARRWRCSAPAGGVAVGRGGAGGGAERGRAAGQRGGDRRADRGASRERRGGDDGDDGARGPERLRARGARRDGAVERVVETKEHGDSTQAEREIREVNTGIFVFAAHALASTLPRLSTDNAQGELYLPQVLDLLRADGATVAAHVVEDERLVLRRQRPRRRSRACARSRRRRSTSATCVAGVGIVDPAATVIDVDVEIGQDTVIEPFTTIRGATRIGRGLHGAPLLPGRLRARGRRQRRAVRLPATGDGAAHGHQGGHVRGGQELRHRPRGAGAAPVLHRRRGRRRGHEPRRGDDHRQLRRPRQAPHDGRQRACARAWTRRSWRR